MLITLDPFWFLFVIGLSATLGYGFGLWSAVKIHRAAKKLFN